MDFINQELSFAKKYWFAYLRVLALGISVAVWLAWSHPVDTYALWAMGAIVCSFAPQFLFVPAIRYWESQGMLALTWSNWSFYAGLSAGVFLLGVSVTMLDAPDSVGFFARATLLGMSNMLVVHFIGIPALNYWTSQKPEVGQPPQEAQQ